MPRVSDRLPSISPDDPTLDLTAGEALDNTPEPTTPVPQPEGRRIALVEGPTPELTGEMEHVLRQRLRLATVLLGLGFLAFLPRHLASMHWDVPAEVVLLVAHVALVLVLSTIALCLFRRCHIPMPRLRTMEMGVFFMPSMLFLGLQWYAMAQSCVDQGGLEFRAGYWLVLMYTYALFIPNTTRRAIFVIGGLALAPIAMLYGSWLFHPAICQAMTVEYLIDIPLVLGISAVTSVLGVDTLQSLRREAFRAKQLGQYRLRRKIGEGGMGEVYLAEHVLLKRPCVVKLIRPEKAGDRRTMARFEREVRATARLTHWNTVEVFDYGIAEDGTFYYVMEHLPGMDMAEWLKRFGPIPPARAIFLLRQACGALQEAHCLGLIHRDIKPGNLYVTQRGGVYDVTKLLDFGLVKPILEEQSLDLTHDGAITGSPLFISPEQATGSGEPDARSDIYSLGAVAFFMLTGRPPFMADKTMQVILAHAKDAPPPLREFQPDVPEDLEAVIMRCLEKDPNDRYQSARELEQALAECDCAGNWDREKARTWWREHLSGESRYRPIGADELA